MTVIDKITQSLEKIGGVEFCGVKLEDADPKLIDISSMTVDIHASIQSPGLAYYGYILRRSRRRLEALEQEFERWKDRKIAAARAALLAGPSAYKPLQEDCRARFQIDNAIALKEWDEKIAAAREEFDALDAWTEAFKQKSFTMRIYAGYNKDEEMATDHVSINPTGSKNIRDILKNK